MVSNLGLTISLRMSYEVESELNYEGITKFFELALLNYVPLLIINVNETSNGKIIFFQTKNYTCFLVIEASSLVSTHLVKQSTLTIKYFL